MNTPLRSAIFGTILTVLLLWTSSFNLYAQGNDRQAHQPGRGMHHPPSVDQIFAKDDKDGDSLISKDEFGGPPDHFALFDTDGDGYLTREEVSASLKNPPRNGGQGPHQGPPPRQPEHPGESFTRLDTDEDGVLSPEEFTGPPEHFSLIDANEDGVLTKEELADAHNRRHGAGHATPHPEAKEETDR